MGNWTNFAWTWGGAFLALLIVSFANQLLTSSHDEWFLLVGSLGALNTLLFAVPSG